MAIVENGGYGPRALSNRPSPSAPNGLNVGCRIASNGLHRMTDVALTTDERTDLDLIARWKAGEQRAATLLVERHADALARFVASIGERNEVEEVVQDTFVRAFASLDGFRGDSALRTWLFTIARRLVLDRRRAARRRGEQVEVHEGDAATEYDSLDGVVADETQRRLRAAMERLSPTQREVFVLRVSEGMSYREIADTVDTTEGAARVHYHNAMRAIKEFLDD
jgi:RNA polymerase sigma-70 factor (ECF subfamily)